MPIRLQLGYVVLLTYVELIIGDDKDGTIALASISDKACSRTNILRFSTW